MKPLIIYLGDLSYFNKYTQGNLYVPLNIGYLASYAKKIFKAEIEISLFKDPVRLLENCRSKKPDLVGLSLYYWNTNLNKITAAKIKSFYGDRVKIVVGGPSIDSDQAEQKKMFKKIPGADFLVPHEGELGFASLIGSYLNKNGKFDNSSIPGVVFMQEGELVQGEKVGFPEDLSQIPSPYLEGYLDEFLTGDFQPLIQTCRGCPYTCAFCVSGKNRSRIRLFPLQQIKEEIKLIAKAFLNRPHFRLYIADDNFGLFERDIEIAEYLKRISAELKYPKHVFFYTDKRFTKISSAILDSLGDLNLHGLAISLQSENSLTLNAIRRVNLKSEEIDAAISWAVSKNMHTTTEMIFGLPFETKESFISLLDRSVKRGFDSILCHNLFLMDGIEMNREEYRKKYNLKTKFRLVGSNYGIINHVFSAEFEEVVVSTSFFSFKDFEIIRNFNFIFYAVYALDFYKWFFQLIQNLDISLVEFFSEFMNPDLELEWPEEYLKFISDFKKAFRAELFDSSAEAAQAAKELYVNNGNEVSAPTRLNILYGARLVYLENSWVEQALRKHLAKFIDLKENKSVGKLVGCVLDLCQKERINLKSANNKVSPITVEFDLIAWKKDKFRTNIFTKAMAPKKIFFKTEPLVQAQIDSFNKEFSRVEDTQYYYNVFDFIIRTGLIYSVYYK